MVHLSVFEIHDVLFFHSKNRDYDLHIFHLNSLFGVCLLDKI